MANLISPTELFDVADNKGEEFVNTTHCALRLAVLLLLCSLIVNPNVWAQPAQVLNPQFVEARDLWQQISSSSLPPGEKAPYGKRFGDLAREQQELWSLAGEVDRGQCTGECVTEYNNRVVAWLSNLSKFSQDARVALESPSLPRVGVWRSYGDWTQINFVCRQTYVCVPAETIMHAPEMTVVSTPATTVTGMCEADQTSPKGCKQCTAASTPPTEPCEWHLEKR